MPPFKPLLPLTEICTDRALTLLTKSLRAAAPPKERMHQRNYVMSMLNSNIRQHLINILFKRSLYKQSLTYKCLLLEMLGDRSTVTVDFSQAGSAYIDEVWHFYRTITIGLMINLTKLGLACNLSNKSDEKYLVDVNTTIHRAFNQMKNLRWVTLIGMADRIMLECLGENCAHLEYLNVSESAKIDDEAVAGLLLKDPLIIDDLSEEDVCLEDIKTCECASTLKFLGISATQVSLLSIAVSLQYIPNLNSFGGPICAGSVSAIIEYLKPEEGCRQFQLKELWDSKILPYQASLLSMMCPRLDCLTIDASSLDSLYIINSITALTLKLYYKNCVDDIYNYLLGSGAHLKELIFVDHIISVLDLSWLSELTPNLEHLEATITKEEGSEVVEWPLLKIAKVTVQSSKVILALLTHTPALSDLDITFSMEPYEETWECINDDLFISVVVAGGLRHLQKLQINECALTMKGIDCLLLHCPELTYMAPVAFWRGISPRDLRAFKRRIRKNNWVLKLVMRVEWENYGEGDSDESDNDDALHEGCDLSG